MVEYKPVPSVRPTEKATPRISVEFPRVNFTQSIGSALGELGRSRQVLGGETQNVGAALASLGKSIAGAGDEIWNRAVAIKQVENDTAATEADTKFMMASAQMDADFQNQTGNAATGGLQAHMKSLEAKRQEIRATLDNPDARHKFDQQSLRTLGRTVFWAAHHAASQGKSAALGAASANFKMTLSDIENHAEHMDPEEFNRRKTEAMDQYDRVVAPLEGLGKGPQAELRKKEITSQLEAARLMGIGKHDATTALKMLDELKAKNEILSPIAQRVQDSLDSRRVNQVTRYEVDKATRDLWDDRDPNEPKKTEAERIDEAKRALPDDLKDDPQAKKMVEDGVISAVRRQESAAREYRTKTFYSLTDDIYGKNGELRKSVEELFAANPENETNYYSLPKTGPMSQRSVRDAINTAVRKDERIDPLVSGQSLEYIRGLMDHTDESRDKLMNMNLWDKDLKDENGKPLKMNPADRKAAIRFRDSLKANPSGDPRVNRAFRWLEGSNGVEMEALGLTTAKKDDADLIAFKGMLGDALEAYESTHKGAVADYKAVTEMIGPQLLRHKAWTIFPPSFGEDPLYKTAVPSEDWKEKYRNSYKLQYGVVPTESEMLHNYNQALWSELYQGGGLTRPKPKASPKKAAEPKEPEE